MRNIKTATGERRKTTQVPAGTYGNRPSTVPNKNALKYARMNFPQPSGSCKRLIPSQSHRVIRSSEGSRQRSMPRSESQKELPLHEETEKKSRKSSSKQDGLGATEKPKKSKKKKEIVAEEKNAHKEKKDENKEETEDKDANERKGAEEKEERDMEGVRKVEEEEKKEDGKYGGEEFERETPPPNAGGEVGNNNKSDNQVEREESPTPNKAPSLPGTVDSSKSKETLQWSDPDPLQKNNPHNTNQLHI